MEKLLPDITIAITTFNRNDLLKETLERLNRFVRYSGEIRYLIGNDGDLAELQKMVATFHSDRIKIVGDGNPRLGLGGNTNRMLKACDTDIVLQTQDDYFLLKEIELDQHVQTLLTDQRAGWIRLKLTKGQDFTATVRGDYWWVSWHSQSQYIASDQPHLKHWSRFHGATPKGFGFYPEGLPVAQTENQWCSDTRARGRIYPGELPEVLIPVEFPGDSAWLHAGDGDLSTTLRGF